MGDGKQEREGTRSTQILSRVDAECGEIMKESGCKGYLASAPLVSLPKKAGAMG
jgi:hypothetical protein